MYRVVSIITFFVVGTTRNRIVLNDVDHADTGIYICQGEYYRQHGMRYIRIALYPDIQSHAVTFALKGKITILKILYYLINCRVLIINTF